MFNKTFAQKKDQGDPMDAKHQAIINNIVVPKAKALGQRGLPREVGDNPETYVGQFRGSYKGLLSECLQPFAGDHQKRAQDEKENLSGRAKIIEKKLEEEREKERMLRLERDQLPVSDYETKGGVWLHAVICVLAFGEGVYTKPAFALFDISSNFFQFFILAMLTLFFIVLPHALVGIFKTTEESKYKHPIRIAVVAIVLLGFWVLASMRTMFLKNIQSSTMQDVEEYSTLPLKEWFFAAVQCLFLVVTCYCAYLAPFAGREERKSNGTAKKIDGKLRAIEAEIEMYQSELQSIPDRIYASENKWSQKATDAEAMKARVSGYFDAAIHMFISENLLNRSDHVSPDCFDKPIAPLV